MDETKLRLYKLGESCWGGAVSRPDICDRLARSGPRINALRGGDVYRINELVRVAEEWQKATVLKYASPVRPWETLSGGGENRDDPRNRGGKVHCG